MCNLKNLSLNLSKCYETQSYQTILSAFSSMSKLETINFEYYKPHSGEELINSLESHTVNNLKKLIIPIESFNFNSKFHNLMSLEITSSYSFQKNNALIEDNDYFIYLKELIFKKEVGALETFYLKKFSNLEKLSLGRKINFWNYGYFFECLGQMKKLNDLDLKFSFYNNGGGSPEINMNGLNNYLIMINALTSLRISCESYSGNENEPFIIGDFSKLSHLTKLTLELKKMKVADFQMREHPSLKHFSFNLSSCGMENNIKIIMSSFLTNCKNLETLSLSPDQEFPLDFLKNLHKLTKLTLRIPKPIEISFPDNLSYLNLYFAFDVTNDHLKLYISCFCGLKKLKHLVLLFAVENADFFFEILQEFFNKQKDQTIETLELNEIYYEPDKIKNFFKNSKGLVKLQLGTNIFFK